MQIGMVGLGRMGANMVRRLQRGGHACVAYDVNADAAAALAGEGATGAASPAALVAALAAPRAIWMMVPAAVVDETIAALASHLEAGDILIDGGNSHYVDDIRRAEALAEKGVRYLDVGTSGGVWGLERGFCLMIGGEADAVRRLDPIFATLAPELASAARTPARARTSATPRRRRSRIPNTIATISIWPMWPKSGGAAASSHRGCSISPRTRSRPILDSTSLRGAYRILARAAGR